MTEKRFSLEKDYDRDGSWEYCYQDNETGRRFNFADDNCDTDFLELVNAVINDLKKENKELKSILQDMGLIMSNEEVKNVRDEIASKLIKPLYNENGFDIDVNTENGFIITPKEVNNDRE